MMRQLFRTVLITTALVILCSLLGYLGSYHWILDLFSHFKIQYLFLLLFGVLILIFYRWKVAFLFIPFIFIIILEISPLYVAEKNGGESRELDRIELVCINLLSSNGSFEEVEKFISEQDPDILVLQEYTQLWQIMLEPSLDIYQYRLAIPRADNFGIAVYSRVQIDKLQELQTGRSGLPSIMGKVRTGDSELTIIATHPLPPVGPNHTAERNEQLLKLGEFLSDSKEEGLIIGDFNTSSFSHVFKRLVEDYNLQDSRNGFGHLATWPSWFPPMKVTLDHCLVTSGIEVLDRGVGPAIGSDHLPIYLTIGLRP